MVKPIRRSPDRLDVFSLQDGVDDMGRLVGVHRGAGADLDSILSNLFSSSPTGV
jgi:hypothetical protein